MGFTGEGEAFGGSPNVSVWSLFLFFSWANLCFVPPKGDKNVSPLMVGSELDWVAEKVYMSDCYSSAVDQRRPGIFLLCGLLLNPPFHLSSLCLVVVSPDNTALGHQLRQKRDGQLLVGGI